MASMAARRNRDRQRRNHLGDHEWRGVAYGVAAPAFGDVG